MELGSLHSYAGCVHVIEAAQEPMTNPFPTLNTLSLLCPQMTMLLREATLKQPGQDDWCPPPDERLALF